MNLFRRTRYLLALAALLLSTSARAELIFPVNESGTGAFTFDQPTGVLDGSTVHVAFIGDAAGTGQFSLYYAAINGAADLTNQATTRAQVLITPAVAIDNGAAYTDARHPRVQLLGPGQVVIVFQAIPAGATDYKLFLALVTVANNAVQTQTVREITDPVTGRMAGRLIDPSFGLVVPERAARVAYTDNTAGNVYCARIAVDNASLVGSPILLTPTAQTRGITPLPGLAVDSQNRTHIAWAANNALGTPSDIYYAMVHEAGAIDNLAIGATSILYGGFRWGFPSVLLPANNGIPRTNSVLVVAADDPLETSGLATTVGVAMVAPDAVTPDGNPVGPGNLISGQTFLVSPPGSSPLADTFSAYHPGAAIDSSNRVHVSGYGFLAPGNLGSAGSYYTMDLLGVTTAPITGYPTTEAVLSSPREPVGTGTLAYATTLPGDYTRTAFVHMNTRAFLFWSAQDNVVSGAHNLYVTSALSSTDLVGASTGCSTVAGPGERNGEIPWAALLLLPAVLLLLRRAARKALAR